MTSGYEPFLIEITESDAPSTDAQITAVEATDAGWFCTADGWTVLVPSLPIKRYGSQVLREAIVPAVGDRLRLYGSLGHQVEGIQVNDVVVYYRDTAMREASRRRWLEDHDAQQRREFVLLQAGLDAEFAALPEFFQARIERFRSESESFRRDSEGYEMFCCTEAVKIARALEADTLGTEGGATTDAIVAAVQAFRDKPYDDQIRIAGLSAGHSGNTFGGACNLAVLYLRHRAGQAVTV